MKFLKVSLTLSLLLVPCAGFAGESPSVVELSSPAAADSGEPDLTVGSDGRLYLSWIESQRSTGLSALRLSVWENDAWSAPRLVTQGKDWFVNWADFPTLAVLGDGSLLAHWLEKTSPATFAYSVRMRISRDQGRTWGKATTPHRDGTHTEHGFVSLVAAGSASFAMCWLDGRETEQKPDKQRGSMTLRFARVGVDGALSQELLLDPRVCDCCQTSATVLSDRSILVVYRDRSSEEVRDVSWVRVKDGKASAPREVHADGWRFEGCPVNGPAVASSGSRVAVAWYTQAQGHKDAGGGDSGTGELGVSRVQLAWADLVKDELRFGSPIRIDVGRPLGRVGVALPRANLAVVSWLEQTEAGADILLRPVTESGKCLGTLKVAETKTSRGSGFPRLQALGEDLFVAWTDASDPPRVRVAKVTLWTDQSQEEGEQK